MDIKARIEQVINEKGLTKKVVAERMGKFNQAFNSLLTNPKWETIELVAKALDISTCEMLFGIKQDEKSSEDMHADIQPAPQPAAESASAEQQAASEQQAGGQQPEQEELPFDKQPSQEQHPQGTTLVGLVRCPQCGRAIRLFAEE